MLDSFLTRLRREIVDETVHHIRRLVPVYTRIPEADLTASIERAFEAVRRLVVASDFKAMSLYLDEVLARRGAIGVGLPELRRNLMIFKDVLVGKILFDAACPESETNALLEHIERLSREVDERLAVFHARKTAPAAAAGSAPPADPLNGLFRATLESLSTPVVLFTVGDFHVVAANAAMRRHKETEPGDDALSFVRGLPGRFERERLERELVTGVPVTPQSYEYQGERCQLLVDRIAVEAADCDCAALSLAGGAFTR